MAAEDAPVFTTEATAVLGEIMLHNSVNVMSRQREENGLMEYPLFTHREVDVSVDQWQRVPLHRALRAGRGAGSGGSRR